MKIKNIFAKMQKTVLTREVAYAILTSELAEMREIGGEKMNTNMDILRGKIAEKKTTQEELATRIGIDPSTFYRKMKSDGVNFTVGQMHKIVEALNLTPAEAASIFLW